MYEVTVDMPNLPTGATVQVPGLGELENGGTYFVNKDEAAAWRSANTRQEAHFDDKGDMVVEMVDPGTLLQVLNKVPGLSVETADSPSDSSNKSPETHVQDPLLPEDVDNGGEKA